MRDRPALACLLLVLLPFVWHLSFPWLLGYDGFFHLAIARRMVEQGLDPTFDWMAFGMFGPQGETWVDHHFGFHALTMPIVALLPPVLAGKVIGSLSFGAALCALYLFLRAERAPHPLLLTLLPVAASWAVCFRFGMVRAMGLSLVLFFACTWLARRGRDGWLFVLAALYSLSYQLSILLIPVAFGAWLAERLLPAEDLPGHPTLRTVAAATAGLALGFALHPDFPNTFGFIVGHASIGLGDRSIPMGAEWSPSTWRDGWMQGYGLVALWLGGGGALAWRAWKQRTLSPAAFLITGGAVCAMILMAMSQRWVELALPLAVVSLGLLWRDADWELPRPALLASIAILALAIPATAYKAAHTGDPDPYRFAGAGRWLQENVEPGTVVHNVKWDEWSELVLWAPHVRYIVGLTPHFLMYADEERFGHYVAVAHEAYGNPSAAVREQFGADFLVVARDRVKDPKVYEDDAGLKRTYLDEFAAVYAVLPVSAPPPSPPAGP